MGLRVAARNGGALRVDQVVARNAMRELELYMPIGFLFARGSDIDAVIILCGIVWCAIFVFFPLFNRDRLRVGDMIAGTWVIKAPKHMLLPDMAERSAPPMPAFVFTTPNSTLRRQGIAGAGERSCATPNRTRDGSRRRTHPHQDRLAQDRPRTQFGISSAYYAALRRRLEQRLLFGMRKRDKHDLS